MLRIAVSAALVATAIVGGAQAQTFPTARSR